MFKNLPTKSAKKPMPNNTSEKELTAA